MSSHAKPPSPPDLTADMLRAIRLFDGMSDAILTLLARELHVEVTAPGDLLMYEGQAESHMFLLLTGEMEVRHQGNRDHSVRVALLGPGDWVGEMAVFEAQPRSASVRSLAPSTLIRLTAADVKRLVRERDTEQYAVFVTNIARELSRRLRVADRVIANANRSVAQQYVLESRRPPPA